MPLRSSACADENDVNSTTCFTLAQRKALKEIYAGPHDGHGKPWYVGTPVGAEYLAPDWFGNLSSGFAFALNDGMAPGMYANIALDPPQGPNFDLLGFNWDKDRNERRRQHVPSATMTVHHAGRLGFRKCLMELRPVQTLCLIWAASSPCTGRAVRSSRYMGGLTPWCRH
jgi:hypothetical protein